MMHCFNKESILSFGPSSRGSLFNVPKFKLPKSGFTLFKRTGSRNPKLIGSDNPFLNEAIPRSKHCIRHGQRRHNRALVDDIGHDCAC